jgi:hypothetical protein
VFETCIPCLPEEFFKYFEKTISEFLSIFFWDFFERIKTNREVEISWIKYDDVFFTVFGDVFEDIINEISMWIKQGKPATINNI